MPAYDYRCHICHTSFEVRRSISEPELATRCPSGHEDTARIFSAVALSGATRGAPQASATTPAASGGCCGGGCCAS